VAEERTATDRSSPPRAIYAWRIALAISAGMLPCAHDLRNELVEELILMGGAKVVQNWTLILREREEAAG
jgi:hypothetical protein